MGRADALIELLGLAPHPEGGWYREVFRSTASVAPDDDRGPRAALTTIWFLLAAGTQSRWHRVRSDEVWHFHEGAPLELLELDADGTRPTRTVLGPVDAEGDARPMHTVPAGRWQAARPLGDHTLVGCTVGPGFDFADFTMMADDATVAARVREAHPELAPLI